jgi:hypothetical protein
MTPKSGWTLHIVDNRGTAADEISASRNPFVTRVSEASPRRRSPEKRNGLARYGRTNPSHDYRHFRTSSPFLSRTKCALPKKKSLPEPCNSAAERGRSATRRDAAEHNLVKAKYLKDKSDFLIHRVVLHFSCFRRSRQRCRVVCTAVAVPLTNCCPENAEDRVRWRHAPE